MQGMNDQALEQVAAFFRAFSVPMRLKLLNALRSGERNVGDLTAEFGCSQANVSKHLTVLAGCGLIEKRQHGTSAYYRIVDPRIYELCDLVCGQIGDRMGRDVALHGMFAGTGKSVAPRRGTRAASGRKT